MNPSDLWIMSNVISLPIWDCSFFTICKLLRSPIVIAAWVGDGSRCAVIEQANVMPKLERADIEPELMWSMQNGMLFRARERQKPAKPGDCNPQ